MDEQLTVSGVVIEELSLSGERVLGHAQLDVPETLNSLSLAMIRALTPALDDWRGRDEVVGVLITGGGDRAFCAGGDIQALYRAIGENHAAGRVVDDYPFRFFEEEYRLDYALHCYPKPVVTIGHGIVMGGGLGIFCGSAIRVLTEKSRLAVPEITIGLFPDAGGTWTLGQMAPHHASFLGLTGSHVNASDALVTGMGTHVVPHDTRADVIAGLQALPWGDDSTANDAMVRQYLEDLEAPALPESELVNVLERDVHVDDFAAEIAATRALAGRSKWVDRGLANLNGGCPTTAGIVVEQLRRVPSLTLAESFMLELNVATHCAQYEDFHEGVRALLIDKDNTPAWRFGAIEHLEWAHVLSHFEAPWPAHPLADLG